MDEVEVLERTRNSPADREELARLRDLLASSSIGLHTLAADGVILDANPADYCRLGYTAPEYIGHNVAEFHADPKVVARLLERLNRGATLHAFPARLLCRDGSIRQVLIDASARVVDGKFANASCLTHDVRDDRLTVNYSANGAGDRSHQLQLVMDSVPALIAYVNADGRYEFANKHFEEWLKLRADELRGRKVSDDLDRAAYRVVKPYIEGALRGEPQEFEEQIPFDAGPRWVHARLIPDKDARGKTIGFFALAVDIGERKALEQEQQRLLAEANQTAEALSAANRAKDEFLGMVSHELRTPLTTILGNAQILTRRLDLLHPSESRSVSDDIYKESVRLTNIVENLLLMARFDAGQKLEMEPMVLRGLVSRVIREVARLSGHHFEMEFPHAVAPIQGNETCIEQVVRNLISNAEKYSRAGTTIEVTIIDEGGSLTLHIADRGLGIAPEEADQVFEPFFRSSVSSSSRSGVGIGLSVCKRLIAAMGGRIWASPRDGGGSVFSFSLPKSVEYPKAPSNLRRT